MVRIYGIKNCGSVKKALNFLEQNKIPYEFIDFKKTPPNKETLEKWLQSVPLKILFNTKGTTYRKLALKDKNLSEEEIKEYLIKEPNLIKRPVIEASHQIIVGFQEEEYKEFKW